MKIKFYTLLIASLVLLPQNSHPMFDPLVNSLKNSVQTSLAKIYTMINDHKIAATIGCVGLATGLGCFLYWKYVKKPNVKKTRNQKSNTRNQRLLENEKQEESTIKYNQLWTLGENAQKFKKTQKELLSKLNFTNSIRFERKSGQRNYLYIQSNLLNLQGRNSSSLMYLHENLALLSPQRQIHYKDALTDNYKIHLMPKSGEDFVYLFKYLLEAIQSNPEFATKIAAIKFHTAIKFETEESIEESLRNNPEREIYPAIVIYPTSSQHDAEFVLNNLYKDLSHLEGSDISPRHNIKVTSLMYYAQGDGDYKGETCLSSDRRSFYDLTEYYERHEGYDDDMALYKSDFIEENVHVDYRLRLC